MKKFLSDVLVDCNLTVSGTTLLGAATGVTVATSDNSTKLATTAWVKNQGYVSTDTTYSVLVPSGTTNIRLASSGGVNDDITISAAGASTVSRVSDSEIRITSVDSVDYISNVALNGNSLDFNGTGNAFAGSIDLSTVTTSFEATDVETVYARVKNVSGGTLVKGTPLAVVTGQTSGIISDVVAADASDPDLMPAVYILNEDIADEAEGEAVIYGKITGIDTSLFDSGDTVYVAPGGGWTTTKPIHPNLIQNLGVITKSHSSNGGGEVMGAGRSNDLPNLTAGKIWVGTTNYPIESTTVHIDETNNSVGIGTTSPETPLHMYKNDSSVSRMLMIDQNGTGDATLSFRLLGVKEYAVGIDNSDGNKFKISNGNAVGSEDYLTIDTTGNVGIGTTSPAEKLHVLSSDNTVARFETSLTSDMAIELKNSQGSMFFGLGGGEEFAVGTDADLNGTNSKFVVKSSGNVGIGTTSPSEELEVVGDVLVHNWVRVKNNQGLYFQDRGGGWHMTDSTWIRAYNGKSIHTTGQGYFGSDVQVHGDLKMAGSDSYIWTPNTTSGYTGFWDTSNARVAMKYINSFGGWGIMGDPEAGTALKVHGKATAETVYINGADDNNGTADFAVGTGGTTSAISLRGHQVQIGGTDMNYTGRLEWNGTSLNLRSWAGNINFATNDSTANTDVRSITFATKPNGAPTTERVRIDGRGYTYFHGLDLAISNVNSDHGAGNYFRGSNTHLVIGTGGTLHLNMSGSTTVMHGTSWYSGAGDNQTELGALGNRFPKIHARAIGSYDSGIFFEDTDAYRCVRPNDMATGSSDGLVSLGWSNNRWKDLYLSGQVNANGGNSSQWNSAYSWGDHSTAGYITRATPATPAVSAVNIVGNTVEVVFSESTTSDIDYYQVWGSVAGSSYGLISQIPMSDFAATMTVVDDTFTSGGLLEYRVYAVKNGVYSAPGTGSVTFTVPTLDVTNMSVVNLNTAYYVQYDLPAERFMTHIEIYVDKQDNSGDLARGTASLVYSGKNTNFMYQIGAADMDKFHQFWVEVVV